MPAKVLSEKQCIHFYRLRDALGDFAYEKLDIEGKLYIGNGKKFSNENKYFEETLADTLSELWETPHILDKFINENPAEFSSGDLEILKSWHNSLQGWYIALRHEDRILFLRDNMLFEVTGLWDEIETLLKGAELPAMVETTLLPFDNKIVHHGFLSRIPVDMGAGIRSMIDSEIEEALRNPTVIRTAFEFNMVAPGIKEKKAKENKEHEDHERVLREGAGKQMEGFHKGALSGLSGEDRENAVRAEMTKTVSSGILKSLIMDLKKSAAKGPVTRDLEKLISNEPKERLKRWALILGADVPGKVGKADLIRAVTPELRSNAFLPELTLRAGLSVKQFEAYRRLYEAGGLAEIMEDEITSMTGLPAPTSLICYVFYTRKSPKGGGKFSFVIPEDIMNILDNMDWDDIHENLLNRDAAANITEAVTELRGIAKADDVYGEFCRFYPAAMNRSEFEEAVIDAITEDRIGCTWLKADGGEDYILHYELAGFYHGGSFDADESDDADDESDEGGYGYADYAVIKGSLEPLEFILEERKNKKARPLEADMLSSSAVFEWKCARPAVRALRDYLDEHVPNSQSDYFFADAVIEDLIDYMTLGTMNGSKTFSEWMSILEEHDYIPNEAHLNRVIGLLTNMYNSLPTWLNNGWAPSELADIMRGRKSFYNKDGSRMKVGRNDPCPCGSGKKYKNCCGRS